MQTVVPTHVINNLNVQLLNAAFCKLDRDWNYTNIVSPFVRVYLITEGRGYIYPNDEKYELKPGYLYIIPSYVHCSYNCSQGHLSQYYVHFTNQLTDGLKISDSVPLNYEVKALPIDYQLFDRLIAINEHAALTQSDPKVYQSENWNENENVSFSEDGRAALETNGILIQILSRFFKGSYQINAQAIQHSRLKDVFTYINTNLNNEIRIDTLSEIACYSTDHFTRQFKKITGLLPIDYINNKRVEKAQLLLVTTNKTQREVSDSLGFSCQQYYSRVFKKIAGCSPGQYRKQHGFV